MRHHPLCDLGTRADRPLSLRDLSRGPHRRLFQCGARETHSGNLASKTNVLGVCDAADVTFSAVSGDVSEAVVVYRDSGVAGTSELIAYIDTATGLPVTPNGGDITITWNASGIFSL